MTFELKEEKDYWAIVAWSPTTIDPSAQREYTPNVVIIQQSKDSYDDDLLCDGAYADDNSLSEEWAEGQPFGVYRLEIEPDRDSDGYLDGISVVSHKFLYGFE